MRREGGMDGSGAEGYLRREGMWVDQERKFGCYM